MFITQPDLGLAIILHSIVVDLRLVTYGLKLDMYYTSLGWFELGLSSCPSKHGILTPQGICGIRNHYGV